MNRFVLVLGILIFLMSFTVVKSTACIDSPCLINFSTSTPNFLTLEPSFIDRIIAKHMTENDTWFINYRVSDIGPDGSGFYDANYLSKYRSGFQIQEQGFTNNWITINHGKESSFIDWLINPTEKLIYYSGTSQTNTHTIGFSNLTAVANVFDSHHLVDEGGALGYVSIADNYISTFYLQSAHTTIKIINLTKSINSASPPHNNFVVDHTLWLPATITDIYNKDNIRLVHVNASNEYWVFLVDQNRDLRLLRYDSNFNFLSNDKVIDGSIYFPDVLASLPAGSVGVGYPSFSVLYSERFNSIVYLVANVFFNNTVRFYAFDIFGTKTTNVATVIDIQNINLTDNDPLLIGGNTTNGITLSIDDNYFYLFYAYNYSGVASSFNYLKESFTCSCSEWVNQSYCIDSNHRQQKRSCVPNSCDTNITYIVDPTCMFTPPENTTTKRVTINDSLCEVHGNNVGETVKCDFPISIPSDCLPNTISVKLSGNVIPEDGRTWTSGFWNLTLCNPSYSCLEYTHPCDQFNWTHEYNKLTYLPAEKYLLQDIGLVDQSCKFSFLGIQKWTLLGRVKIECDEFCGGKTICGSGDYFGYSCNERSDCYQTDCNFCQFGCNENTGSCLTEQTQQQQQENIGQSVGAPIGTLVNMGLLGMDSMFSNSDSKIVGATIITLCVGIGISLIIKSEKGIIFGIISMLPVFFFFAVRGYYPIWITLLVAIPSVAFIVVLLSGLKHTQGG